MIRYFRKFHPNGLPWKDWAILVKPNGIQVWWGSASKINQDDFITGYAVPHYEAEKRVAKKLNEGYKPFTPAPRLPRPKRGPYAGQDLNDPAPPPKPPAPPKAEPPKAPPKAAPDPATPKPADPKPAPETTDRGSRHIEGLIRDPSLLKGEDVFF